jgi:hypothetical protein
MISSEHHTTAARAARRAAALREALGPGFALAGASESTLCYASRLGWSQADRLLRPGD